jgi:putative FmdB family regulatory protein
VPIYEYQCDQCGEHFELLVPMSAMNDPAPCPACGSEETRKQLSTFATSGRSSSASSAACAPTGG